MTEEFNLDREFCNACIAHDIKFEDCRYYCNEGVIYEFKTKDDLRKAAEIYVGLAFKDPDGFKVELHSYEDVHHLFSMYPDMDYGKEDLPFD